MLKQNKAIKRAYSFVAFSWTLGHWLLHFLKANKKIFGWQFRYLTQWALTASMLFHMCTLLHRCMWRRQPTVRKTAYMLAVSVCVVNMLVFVLYWPAFFLQPGLIGALTMSVSQDVFVHAVSPLSVFFDAMFWSKPFKKEHYKSSQAFTFAVFLSYVFWLEVLVTPLGKMPYAFLRVAPWTHRCLCYVVSFVIGLVLHRMFFFGVSGFTACSRSKPRVAKTMVSSPKLVSGMLAKASLSSQTARQRVDDFPMDDVDKSTATPRDGLTGEGL